MNLIPVPGKAGMEFFRQDYETPAPELVARMHFDLTHQLTQVVVFHGIADDVKLAVLRIAASHAERYLVSRMTITNTLMSGPKGAMSRTHSIEYLSDGIIPEAIAELDAEALIERLRHLDIEVVLSVPAAIGDAIALAIAGDERLAGVTYQLGEMYGELYQMVTFTVDAGAENPRRFRAWDSMYRPSRHMDLHVVPHYHPCMSDWECAILVNGDTDSVIGNQAVDRILVPNEARTREPGMGQSTWMYVDHPFYGAGQTVEMRLGTNLILEQEAIDFLRNVLLALLELDDKYVGISGGFRSPFGYSQNMASRLGIPGRARGSESHCAWSVAILRQEGVLDQAFVPDWYESEGWAGANWQLASYE